jgi:putative ATPase
MDQNISIVIYLDEVHRLSTNQQDVLLPYVESGSLIFIGATTENPFHSVNSALLSRCLTFQLEPLGLKDLLKILVRGLDWYREKGKDVQVDTDAAKRMAALSCGDGRKILTILEMAVEVAEVNHITLETVNSVAPSKFMIFSQDMHFDLASCFQGSIQASDADSAVYWLARWLESGEDPRYIARRLLVSAAEDGFSNPLCIAVAHAAYTSACEVGRPECDIVLSAATILVATAKRDKSAAMAIWSAVKDVRDNLDVLIPKEMKDCHYAGAAKLGHGAYKDGMNQDKYVGVNKKYYKPWT